jgi:hypothetical protein
VNVAGGRYREDEEGEVDHDVISVTTCNSASCQFYMIYWVKETLSALSLHGNVGAVTHVP